MQLTQREVLDAMIALGTKKKAHSWDNVQDLIFSQRAYKRMRLTLPESTGS